MSLFGHKPKRAQIQIYDEFSGESEVPVQNPTKNPRPKGLQDITNVITNRLRDADLGAGAKKQPSFGEVYKPKVSSSRARGGSRGPSPTVQTSAATFDDSRRSIPTLVPILDQTENNSQLMFSTPKGEPREGLNPSPLLTSQPAKQFPPYLYTDTSPEKEESISQFSPLENGTEFFAQKRVFTHITDTVRKKPLSPRRQAFTRSQSGKSKQEMIKPKPIKHSLTSVGSPKHDFGEDSDGDNSETDDIVVSPSRVRGLSIDTTIPTLTMDQNVDSPRFFESPTPTERGVFGWNSTMLPRVMSSESLSTPTGVFRTPSCDTIMQQDRKSAEFKMPVLRPSQSDGRERARSSGGALRPQLKKPMQDSDGDTEMGGVGTPPGSPTKLQSLLNQTASSSFLSPTQTDVASPSSMLKILSPDPKAFDEKQALEKKKNDGKSSKKLNLPPTPDRNKLKRSPLVRGDSLWENKILKVFFGSGEVTGKQEWAEMHQIGQGAFFAVFRVKDKATGKLYAVKKAKQTFRGKQDRQAYLKEMEVAAHLKPHDNVIRYYQAWQESGYFNLQMEYCNCNLTEYVEQLMNHSTSPPGSRRGLEAISGKATTTHTRGLAGHYKITNEFLADVCKQISQGLNHIHNVYVLHLDIKPDNILVSTTNPLQPVYKLADFGHASLKKDWKDGGEGDSMYMAPELLVANEGEPLSPRSPRGPRASTKADIFSLGLLLFEIATGAGLPSSGPLWHKLRTGQAGELLSQASCGAVVRALHPGLKQLILTMLNPQAELRPSAEQILAFLAQLVFTASPSPTPTNFEALLKSSAPPTQTSGYFWNNIPATRQSSLSMSNSGKSSHSSPSPSAHSTPSPLERTLSLPHTTVSPDKMST